MKTVDASNAFNWAHGIHLVEENGVLFTAPIASEKKRLAARYAEILIDHYDHFQGSKIIPAEVVGQSPSIEQFREIFAGSSIDADFQYQFAAMSQMLPFVQIMNDIKAMSDSEAHDKDSDMRDFVRGELELEPGEHLLDAGCSTGCNFLSVPQDVNCLGIDFNLPSLFTGARATRNQNKPHFLCHGDIMNVPLADNSVDAIQCFVVLGLLPINVALTELRRVLKPGGKLVFTIEGTGYCQELRDDTNDSIRRKVGLFRWHLGRKLQERGIFWQGKPVVGRLAGLIQYTPDSISKIVRANGFDDVKATIIRTYKGEPRIVGISAT